VWCERPSSVHDGGMTSIRRYFAVTWSAQTWREILYLILGLPLGLVWFVYAITMYVTGISLVIVWIGVPLLIFTHLSPRAQDRSRRRADGLTHLSTIPACGVCFCGCP